MDNPIRQLAQLHGIADSYFDWRGQPKQVSVESQSAILAALGVDAASADAAEKAIHEHEARRWTGFVPPVAVFSAVKPVSLPLAVPVELEARSVEWSVTLESGERRSGVAKLGTLQKIEEGEFDARSYRRCQLPLPDLPLGYHAACVALDT